MSLSVYLYHQNVSRVLGKQLGEEDDTGRLEPYSTKKPNFAIRQLDNYYSGSNFKQN